MPTARTNQTSDMSYALDSTDVAAAAYRDECRRLRAAIQALADRAAPIAPGELAGLLAGV